MSQWLDVVIIEEIELAFLGQKSMKQAMNDAAKKVNKILKEINQ